MALLRDLIIAFNGRAYSVQEYARVILTDEPIAVMLKG